MKIHQNFKSRLLLTYVLLTLLVLAGSGLLLKNQWDELIKTSGTIAVKNLEITSGITKNIIANRSKLLDITNSELHQLIVEHHYDANSIQKVIANSSSKLSLDKDIQNYGLLLVIDRDGNLIARSDSTPPSLLNFNDRRYFQALKNKSDKPFSIGPLLQARTTNKHVFHIATPIKDAAGRFNGVLVLQVGEDSFISMINLVINSPNETITALTKSNEIIFTTAPEEITPNMKSGLNFFEINPDIKLGENMQWNRQDGLVIAQVDSPSLEIQYVSIQPISKIFSNFLKSNFNVLAIVVLSYFVFSFLILFIYHQLIEIENARISALIDPLTQLPNRRAFDERYELLLKDSVRSHSDISVLFIDIDKFKNCNDQYGHENGDLILKKLADIIQCNMRRPLDFCCRWGGEEFVTLLPDTDIAGANKVAGHILEAVRETAISLVGYPPINITVSIGIACGHHASNQAADNNLVDRADQAMYRAKQAGRDRYSL